MEEETLTLDELLRENRGYQSAFDQKVEKALQTARANWEREREVALEEERQAAEAEARQRLAGEQQALEQQRAEYEADVRRMEVADRLLELGLSPKFAGWLTGNTREESLARVAEFEESFRSAVGDSVLSRMSAPAPHIPEPSPAMDRDTIRGMSPREINARWAEIQDTLKG